MDSYKDPALCIRGHVLAEVGTYRYPSGKQRCRACIAEGHARRRELREKARAEEEGIQRVTYVPVPRPVGRWTPAVDWAARVEGQLIAIRPGTELAADASRPRADWEWCQWHPHTARNTEVTGDGDEVCRTCAQQDRRVASLIERGRTCRYGHDLSGWWRDDHGRPCCPACNSSI